MTEALVWTVLGAACGWALVTVTWEMARRRYGRTLEAVREWATTYPDSDPTITNPAMIGHFAGYQKARETVRGILGIDEEEFMDLIEAEERNQVPGRNLVEGLSPTESPEAGTDRRDE